MTTTERTQLRDAIIAYLRSETDPTKAPTSPDYYVHPAHHNMHFNQVHHQHTTIFFTWHRYYIQEMEHWFVEHGYEQFVPLPSWNPNHTPIVPNAFMDPINAITATQYGSLSSANSSPNSNLPYLVPNACSFTNPDDFSDNLEILYHDKVHNEIGGTMGTGYSAAAAIFWPWHAYVDDLWFCYQRNCKELQSDLYVKKYATDEGVSPIPASQPSSVLWTAPDIWVRNNPDGFQNQVSEPLTNTSPTDKAYVYVKVMNRGAAPNEDGTSNINTYWAQGSVGLQWPNPWTGGTTITCGGVARPLGGIISSKPLRRVNEDFTDPTQTPAVLRKDYHIYEFEWDMPDPDNYSCFSEVWEQEHFCILARVNDELGTPTGNDIYDDMTNSNNIAMRNITILKDDVETAPGVPKPGSILWGNYTNSTVGNTKLLIKFASEVDAQLLNVATLTLTVDDATRGQWISSGSHGANVRLNGNMFSVQSDNASVSGFTLPANTIKGLTVTVNPKPDKSIDRPYEFDLIQYNDGEIASGERYIVQVGSGTAQRGVAGAIKSNDPAGFDIYPNPAQNSFTITFNNKDNETVYVALYDNMGRKVKEYQQVTTKQELSVATLPSGLYLVKIISATNGIIGTQKLIINR